MDIIRIPLRVIHAYACELFLIAMLVVIIMIVKYAIMNNSKKQMHNYQMFQMIDPFTQKKEGFSPQYEKELELFKSMNFNEQQQYLDLTREQKLAKYGGQIM